MSDKYRQVMKQLTEKPWAIMPNRFEVILDIVRQRAAGETLSEAEIEARISGGPGRRTAERSGTVAVLPLSGPIVPKAGLMTQVSGATSVQAFRDQYLAAMNDPDVSAIVLDVDSPGGVTDLLPELAATMRQQRGRKPVLAVADTLMASAAYWIGAQADEVAVTPSGLAGSIGVFAAHDDFSEQMASDGVKTTLVSAGKYKTDGNPYEPLSDSARAHLQELVDSTYAQFTLDVARGRGVSVEAVRSGYGEGRVIDAKAAVKAGLADRVASLDETVARAAELAPARRTRSQAAVSWTSTATSTTNVPASIAMLGEKGSAGVIEPDAVTLASDTPPDVDAAPVASLAAMLNEALCAAEELVDQGRTLTAAKREQLEALRERIDLIVADPSRNTLTEDDEFALISALARTNR